MITVAQGSQLGKAGVLRPRFHRGNS